ncbi:MAG: hypothetical protein JXA15_09140 [Spirochaetales bacterium]|nr:hypothetical protein [Spirochaetales bacterium]
MRQPRKSSRSPVATLVATVLALASTACSAKPTEIWTDRPELAVYASVFNAAQSRYRVVVRHHESLAEAAAAARRKPALVIGSYLRAESFRKQLVSLDYLFGELAINQSLFYPELLAKGNVDGRQLLLPLSFNLPLAAFRDVDPPPLSVGAVASLADLEPAALAFNRKSGRDFTAMGFSPRWSGEAMMLTAWASGVAFREGSPLAWSDEGLDKAIASLRDWAVRVNGSIEAEDDFQFKYLYLPDYASVLEGRTLFAVLRSDRFFLVPEAPRGLLDFRWLGEGGKTPVLEDAVWAGILRGGSGKQGAEAFLGWLFSEPTQAELLQASKRLRLSESVFGIAGGFSSLSTVNDRWFPLVYPAMEGRTVAGPNLVAPEILPSGWLSIETEVVIPFLETASGQNPPDDARSDIRTRLAEWVAGSK